LNGDADGLEQSDSRPKKKTQRPAEKGNPAFQPDWPSVRSFNLELIQKGEEFLIPLQPKIDEEKEKDSPKQEKNISSHCRRKGEEASGYGRKLGLKIGIKLRKPRKDKIDQNADKNKSEDEEESRIGQSRLHPGFRLGNGLGIIDIAADRTGQVSASLSSHKGGRINRGEDSFKGDKGF